MPLRDFWIDVKRAARLLSPVVVADSPTLDARRIEAILENADIWLTKRTIDGFDEADFGFLSNDERRRLVECVDQFREVAASVPANAAATPEQIAVARPAFTGILEVLRPDKFGDPESLRVGKLVEQKIRPNLPAWVHDLRFESGNDASGDPALWVWVEVDDDAANGKTFSAAAKPVREQIEQAVRSSANNVWPYVRFRTVSEQASFQE